MLVNPLKTILKGFWWHIAVGPTNLLSHVFYKKWHDLTSFVLWNMWRGRRSCLPAGARPLIGSYSLSYREEQSPPSWFVFSFVWKCSLNYKHGCHLGNEKGRFVSFVFLRFCWVLNKTMSPVQSWLCRLSNKERKWGPKVVHQRRRDFNSLYVLMVKLEVKSNLFFKAFKFEIHAELLYALENNGILSFTVNCHNEESYGLWIRVMAQ